MNSSPPSEDSTKCTLASHRPLAKKSVLLPKHSSITRANNAEVIFSSKAGPPKKLLLYYCIGDLLVRPVGFFTGVITAEYQRIVPYVMRRSNGQIATVPFDATDYQMVHDLKAIMEVNVAPYHTTGVVFKAEQSAKIFVYGEIAHGFAFVAPSKLELAGCLYLARWSRDGLIEEAVNRNVVVQLVAGIANVFVCDFREVVVMFDQEAKFTLTLQEAESDRQRPSIGRGATSPAGALSPTSMDSASPTPPSHDSTQLLLAAPQPRLAIEAPKMVAPAKETPVKLSSERQSDDKSNKTQSFRKGNQQINNQSKVQAEKSGMSVPEPVSLPAQVPVAVPAPVQVLVPVPVHASELISVPFPTPVPVSAPKDVPESQAILIAPKPMNEPKVSEARERSSKGEQPKAAKELSVKETPVKLSTKHQSDDKSSKTLSFRKGNQETNTQSKVVQVEKSGKAVPEPVSVPVPVPVSVPAPVQVSVPVSEHAPEPISVPSPTPVPVSAPNDVPESQAIFIAPKPVNEPKASEAREVSSKGEQPKATTPSTSSPVESPKSLAEPGLSLESSMPMESAQELKQEMPPVPQAGGMITIQDTKPIETIAPIVSAPSPSPKIPENEENKAQVSPKTADDPLVKEKTHEKESNLKVASAVFMKPHSRSPKSKSSSSSPVSSSKHSPNGSKTSGKSAQSKRDKKRSKRPKKSGKSKGRDKAKSKSKAKPKPKTPERSSAGKALDGFVSLAATDNDLSKSTLSKSSSSPVAGKASSTGHSPKSPKSRIASKSTLSTSSSSQATSLTLGSNKKNEQKKKVKSAASLQSIKTDARKAPIGSDTVPSGSSAQGKSDHAKKKISPSKPKVKSAKSGRKNTKGNKTKDSRGTKKDKTAKTPSEVTQKKPVVKPVIKAGNSGNFTINQISPNEPKKGNEATFQQKTSPASGSGATASSGESSASSPPPPRNSAVTTEPQRNVNQRTAGEVLEALRKIKDKRSAIKSAGQQVSQTKKTVKSPAKDVSITPTTSPTSFDRKDTAQRKKKTRPDSDLMESILKIRKSKERRAKTGKGAKSATGKPKTASPSGTVPRVASVDTLKKKQKAKAELEQLMRDLDNSSNKLTAIKSSHGSQEEMAPDPKGAPTMSEAEKRAMTDEVEAFRVKMGKVIAVLAQLVENITITLREELLEDVALLQHCSDAMTPQQFDEYSARILDVAKKIDRLLGTFQA